MNTMHVANANQTRWFFLDMDMVCFFGQENHLVSKIYKDNQQP